MSRVCLNCKTKIVSPPRPDALAQGQLCFWPSAKRGMSSPKRFAYLDAESSHENRGNSAGLLTPKAQIVELSAARISPSKLAKPNHSNSTLISPASAEDTIWISTCCLQGLHLSSCVC